MSPGDGSEAHVAYAGTWGRQRGSGDLNIAVIFPGQGAQAPGLGQPWVDHPSWILVERAEKATGADLANLLLDAPAEALTRTREAQLVVFLASLLAWDAA